MCETGYLDSAALSQLRKLYEEVLAERGVAEGSQVAEEVAATIMAIYLTGTTDEAEIRHMLDWPRAA